MPAQLPKLYCTFREKYINYERESIRSRHIPTSCSTSPVKQLVWCCNDRCSITRNYRDFLCVATSI